MLNMLTFAMSSRDQDVIALEWIRWLMLILGYLQLSKLYWP